LKWYNVFETFIETEDSCCVPRFPLIASCYKIVDSQTLFTLRYGVGSRSRKFWKGRTFYLQLRNSGYPGPRCSFPGGSLMRRLYWQTQVVKALQVAWTFIAEGNM